MLLTEDLINKMYAGMAPSSNGTFAFCRKCELKDGCRTPAMAGTGKGERSVLFIAEAPGRKEDQYGIQLIGDAGQLLRKELKDLDFDLDRDARKINAVNCRPPRNRTPTMKEIRACRPMVLSEIYSFQPKVIVLLGDVAVKSYYMGRLKNVDSYSMRGWAVPDLENKAWVVSTYHPSYLVRLGDGKSREKDKLILVRREFRNHLKLALDLTEKPLPSDTQEDLLEKVFVLEEGNGLEETLEAVLREARKAHENGQRGYALAFDYEATGIKPFMEGHNIVCASFCVDKDRAFAFRMPSRKRSRARELWEKVLTSPYIGKVAHNAKFEDLWTRKILGFQVRPWVGDTMLMSHFLDNRGHINSLKFQSAVRFGIFGYEKEVEEFLRPAAKDQASRGALAINQIHKAPSKLLLRYCGMDSLLTFRLYRLFQKLIAERR